MSRRCPSSGASKKREHKHENTFDVGCSLFSTAARPRMYIFYLLLINKSSILFHTVVCMSKNRASPERRRVPSPDLLRRRDDPPPIARSSSWHSGDGIAEDAERIEIVFKTVRQQILRCFRPIAIATMSHVGNGKEERRYGVFAALAVTTKVVLSMHTTFERPRRNPFRKLYTKVDAMRSRHGVEAPSVAILEARALADGRFKYPCPPWSSELLRTVSGVPEYGRAYYDLVFGWDRVSGDPPRSVKDIMKLFKECLKEAETIFDGLARAGGKGNASGGEGSAGGGDGAADGGIRFVPIGHIASGTFGSVVRVAVVRAPPDAEIDTGKEYVVKTVLLTDDDRVRTDGLAIDVLREIFIMREADPAYMNPVLAVTFDPWGSERVEGSDRVVQTTSGVLQLFMEEHVDLIRYMRRPSDGNVEALDDATWRTFAEQLLEGLRYIHHSLRVTHRDIKPNNILVDKRSVPLRAIYTDFGASRRATETLTTNARGSDMFALTYRAPEILVADWYHEKEEEAESDAESEAETTEKTESQSSSMMGARPFSGDVWALACVFVFMDSGRNWFTASSVEEALVNIFSTLGAPETPCVLFRGGIVPETFARSTLSRHGPKRKRGKTLSGAKTTEAWTMRNVERVDLVRAMTVADNYDPNTRIGSESALSRLHRIARTPWSEYKNYKKRRR